MKYKFEIEMTLRDNLGTKKVTHSVPHKGQMKVDKMVAILDELYFDYLPDHYPAATAVVTSTSPKTETRFTRVAGSNAAGVWKQPLQFAPNAVVTHGYRRT